MSKTNYTRRDIFKLGTAGAAAIGATPAIIDTGAIAAGRKQGPVSESGGCCITKSGDFYNVERGNPLPYKLPIEKQREIGMVRETWQLEIIAEPESNSKITRPMLRADGTALTFERLMEIAKTKATSYLKVITCNNLADPLGHGLWEGVPLRDVLWHCGPVENLRHVYYHGHHNEDPKQMFKCYLPMNRIFEDPPGELPVLLCYKLNGEFLTGERGGPVRMIVPEAYGFKSVKWLQRIVFTNNHQADDTYANGNNDINSWLKTFARFGDVPDKIGAGTRINVALDVAIKRDRPGRSNTMRVDHHPAVAVKDVVAVTAIERVVAGIAEKDIGSHVTGDDIIVARARDILETPGVHHPLPGILRCALQPQVERDPGRGDVGRATP